MARSQFDPYRLDPMHEDRALLNWEVEFEGFVSSIGRLKQRGWQVTVDRDVMRMAIRVAVRLPIRGGDRGGLIFTGEFSDYDMMRRAPMDRPVLRLTGVMSDVSNVHIMEHMAPVWRDQPVSAVPKFPTSYKAVDFYGFNEAAKTPTGLYIPQDRIGEALEMIHKLQAPDQAAIRARNREVPAEKLEAVILSIAA